MTKTSESISVPQLPLSRELILRAALRLADEGGVEALSMRKIAQVLGVKAMSLYNHVANKDDILDGIVDRVVAE
ncbi:MAG: TetR family transcriptional regulator, partial [Cyanobacteria bacterium P01_H01_bin.58]